MKECISREAALAALKTYNREPFHILHALTVEGVMRWYANELGYGEDGDFWATVGLLHDIDFEMWPEQREAGVATPVLMLTAKSDVGDRIHGLDCGADYYLTKPFEPEELLACVRTLLRRSGGQLQESDTLTWGDLSLERTTFTLSCAEREVRLSRREYDLIELLMRNGNQVVTKEQMLVKVWGYDSQAEDNNVEVYISFLRRKLTHLHSAVKIKTLRMLGYCLTQEVEA